MTQSATCRGRGRRNKSGFSLLIMMLAIALLGVFAVVATRLIGTTMRLYREAAQIDAEARRVDEAMEQLRRDVWSARQATVAGAQSATIDNGAGRGATWSVDPDGALVRSEPAAAEAPRRWPEVGGRMSFAWDGVALTVRGADRGADSTGGVRMTSQVKLAEAGGAR